MSFCPKCGRILKKDEMECSKCHTKIINEEIETLFEKPKKIKKSKIVEKTTKKSKEKKEKKEKKVKKLKKVKSENLDLTKVNLTVKKNNKKSLIFIILTISFLVLMLITIILVNNLNKKESPAIELATKERSIEYVFNGKWKTTNNNLFEFNNDNTFKWYKDIDDLNDNYYTGTYTYLNGVEAIIDIGYTEETFEKEFGQDIIKDNVYSIEMLPSKAMLNGKDETKNSIPINTKWKYVLIIKKDGSSMSYNQTLNQRYNLELIKK